MKTTKIKLRNSQTFQTIEVFVLAIEKDFIDVAEIIEQEEVPYLLKFPAHNLVSLLDLSNATPYEIWYFNDDLKFFGKGFSLFTGKGSFRIQTQARYVLLLNREASFYDELRNLKCEDLSFNIE